MHHLLVALSSHGFGHVAPAAAPAHTSLPGIAMCSLNWADIYAHYFHGHHSAARAIYGQIREAYQCATCFIQTEPSMPMASLPRRLPVVPTGIGQVVEFLLQHGLGERPTYGSGPA